MVGVVVGEDAVVAAGVTVRGEDVPTAAADHNPR